MIHYSRPDSSTQTPDRPDELPFAVLGWRLLSCRTLPAKAPHQQFGRTVMEQDAGAGRSEMILHSGPPISSSVVRLLAARRLQALGAPNSIVPKDG